MSRLPASNDVIRACKVSTSDVEVVEEDFKVCSSLSRDDLAFSANLLLSTCVIIGSSFKYIPSSFNLVRTSSTVFCAFSTLARRPSMRVSEVRTEFSNSISTRSLSAANSSCSRAFAVIASRTDRTSSAVGESRVELRVCWGTLR